MLTNLITQEMFLDPSGKSVAFTKIRKICASPRREIASGLSHVCTAQIAKPVATSIMAPIMTAART
jgi:hypothetical protein